MTYPINVNIPAANNDPADDQPLMQTNFANINSYLQVDHTNPATTGAGEHKQVTFNSNNVPAIPTSPPVLFTNNDAFSTPQLFFYSGNAAKSSNQYVASTNGSTYLLGGIIVKWGSGNANQSGTVNSFTSAFPNNCYSVLVTPTDTAYTGTFAVTAVSTTGFTAKRQSGSGVTGFYYLAIGN